MHVRIPVSISHTVPGVQQEIRRMKILSRFGFDRALNIFANCSISIVRMFDIYRILRHYVAAVKVRLAGYKESVRL